MGSLILLTICTISIIIWIHFFTFQTTTFIGVYTGVKTSVAEKNTNFDYSNNRFKLSAHKASAVFRFEFD